MTNKTSIIIYFKSSITDKDILNINNMYMYYIFYKYML